MVDLSLPREAEAFTAAFEAFFNTGDLDQLSKLFEPEAVIRLQDGRVARGVAQVRDVLAGFLSLGLPISITPGYTVVNAPYAINSATWRLAGRDRNGVDVHIEATTCDVLHRGGDGVWRHVIDNPFGTAVAERG